MPQKRKRPLSVPEDAARFTLHRHTKDERGKEHRTKLKGPDPSADGTLADTWDASDFSPAKVLATWGPGLYRVDFYNVAGDHVRESGQVFEVAAPAKEARVRRRGRSAPEPEDDVEDPPRARATPRPTEVFARAANGGQVGILELLALQDAARRDAELAAERRAERDRVESEQRMQRDREFMQTMIAAMRGGGGGATTDPELVRREIALGHREMRLELRSELRTALGQLSAATGGGGDDDDDGADPPESIEEGLEQLGGAVLSDLTQRMPNLVGELFTWLKAKGYQPSGEVAAQMGAVFSGGPGANGAARG